MPASGSCARCKASLIPQGANKRFARGWHTSTPWSPLRVGPSMPAKVAWQWKEAQCPHATGSSTSKSSRLEAFDER